MAVIVSLSINGVFISQVMLSAFRGHLSTEKLVAEDRSDLLSTTNHERHFIAPGVKRIPVRYGNVRGCLFLPPGNDRCWTYMYYNIFLKSRFFIMLVLSLNTSYFIILRQNQLPFNLEYL